MPLNHLIYSTWFHGRQSAWLDVIYDAFYQPCTLGFQSLMLVYQLARTVGFGTVANFVCLGFLELFKPLNLAFEFFCANTPQ